MIAILRLASLGLCCLSGLSFTSQASAATFHPDCGRTIRTASKAVEETFAFKLEEYVQLPGGTVSLTVPSGKRRCIRVTFSTIGNCPSGCFVRVDDNNASVPPGTSPRFSNSAAGARSFQWIEQVAPGNHQITVKVITGGESSVAHFGPYTTVVEVMANPP